MPEPTLRNIWNVIAFLEQCPDDVHAGFANAWVAAQLRRIHEAYVTGPAKKTGPAQPEISRDRESEATAESRATETLS